MASLQPGRLLAAIAVLLAVGVPAHADKCTRAKLKAVATKEFRLLGCLAKAAATGDSSQLSACEMKGEAKFNKSFAKAGTCAGDAATCEDVADTCASSVAGAFTDMFPSACEAVKLKAAAKFVKTELGCYRTATARDVERNAECTDNALFGFHAALAKAGPCPDGGDLVERKCVLAAATTDPSGQVASDLCTPNTTLLSCSYACLSCNCANGAAISVCALCQGPPLGAPVTCAESRIVAVATCDSNYDGPGNCATADCFDTCDPARRRCQDPPTTTTTSTTLPSTPMCCQSNVGVCFWARDCTLPGGPPGQFGPPGSVCDGQGGQCIVPPPPPQSGDCCQGPSPNENLCLGGPNVVAACSNLGWQLTTGVCTLNGCQ